MAYVVARFVALGDVNTGVAGFAEGLRFLSGLIGVIRVILSFVITVKMYALFAQLRGHGH